MSAFVSFMPLFKLAAVFIIMLTAIRCRLGLMLSICLGSMTMALLFKLPASLWPATVGEALAQPQTLFLAVIVALILLLSDVLDKTGQAGRLMDSLSGYLRHPRLRLVFFPVLIGLLPMPGGAVFSAPMLGSVSEKLRVPARDRVLLNYWFRHVWETWWPLYPGIILAASITGLSIGHIALYGLPGMVVMLALGWFFMLRPGVLELDAEAAGEVHERNHGKVLRFGLPLLVAILGAVGMEVGISLFMPSVPFEYGVILALSASILVAVGQNPGSVSIVVRSVTNKHLWVMLGVVASIFIFKDTMQAAGVIRELSELAGGTTALVVSATLLPYLVGLVSGITLAYVGATFPLLTGLLAQAGLQDQTAAYVMLSIFSGFTGIMSSPMHICFVLSCQYFKVDIGGTWRKLVMPCVLLISSGIVYFILLR
ncbi:DUF401 family protein [Desulfovibrio subterraneus]|jgi:integral membrane protein (TIGR00529 family)|uniref:DUF401 family protein n=1 Tax=Desulfovibrio subterraneus TaxID=2718620 RepID=A0A7J0BHD4_9BACT|nr:DUF401 family protein [Desulfovibrio subterraneus]WBF66775.1 DUF401 family protein [Desulfovibrio subterraneus]GFM32494.1 hypothetical protein DSM101010T_08590 [Desulfovibrio subterraneus]